jgi:hypothetical protein
METLLLHEYLLTVYGILIWQFEQYFSFNGTIKEYLKYSYRTIGRSLIWGGIIVIFDDEILAKYNEWAEYDYIDMPLYMYTVAGFFVDVIRTKITKTIDSTKDS